MKGSRMKRAFKHLLGIERAVTRYSLTPSPHMEALIARSSDAFGIFNDYWYLELKAGNLTCCEIGPYHLGGTPSWGMVTVNGNLDNFKLTCGIHPDLYITGSVGVGDSDINFHSTMVYADSTITIDFFDLNINGNDIGRTWQLMPVADVAGKETTAELIILKRRNNVLYIHSKGLS